MIWRCHLIHCVELTVRAQREAQHSWWHLPQAVGMSPGRWLWFWAIVTVPGLGTSRIYALCACTQLSEAFLESLRAGYGWPQGFLFQRSPQALGYPSEQEANFWRQTATLALLAPNCGTTKQPCALFQILDFFFCLLHWGRYKLRCKARGLAEIYNKDCNQRHIWKQVKKKKTVAEGL